jgi:hypothetical protein
MKKLLTVLVMSLCTLAVNAASAHGGAEPKHGGVVQAAGDLSFELTARDNGATIYVEDHGKPLSTAGMTGRLTVLNGGERSDTELKSAGENTLDAEGVSIISGSRAVAALKSADGTVLTIRFSVK